jgi:hypothetical protein
MGLLCFPTAVFSHPIVRGPKAIKTADPVKAEYLDHLSQVFQARRVAAQHLSSPLDRKGQVGPVEDVFNKDDVGFPQNEESVTVCKNKPQIAEGGTNDYRGLLDPQMNFTGWYLSTNAGETVRNEGLLPALRAANGQLLPSGGDPVSQSDEGCNIYMLDLNYPADNPFVGVNGVGLYKSTPQRLATCPQGRDPNHLTHPACWPQRRFVAQAQAPGGFGHFLDKPWMDVGQSGNAGEVVWITYSDFTQNPNSPLGFTGAQIKAVRCTADLKTCTNPILISGADQDVQFSDVTISESGRTLVTWAEIQGELQQKPQTFVIKARIAPPGSTHFGPTHVVATETLPMGFGDKLHANDFRIATYPKSIMPTVNGHERIYVTWDRCRARVPSLIANFSCEEGEILLSHSNDLGQTWSKPRRISLEGDNYFPAISDEVGSPNFVIAYYTNRFDRVFHNQQDVEMVTIDAASGRVKDRERVTRLSNETEADPLLGGIFIGDYFDVHLLRGTAYVHYNANYRHIRVLGEGFPIPQQDNYLTKVHVRT